MDIRRLADKRRKERLYVLLHILGGLSTFLPHLSTFSWASFRFCSNDWIARRDLLNYFNPSAYVWCGKLTHLDCVEVGLLACFVEGKESFFRASFSPYRGMCVMLKTYPPILLINSRLTGAMFITWRTYPPRLWKSWWGNKTLQSYPHLLWIM